MELINKSEKLIQWVEKQIYGLEISADERTRIAASCHDVAMEHQKSIVLLASHSLYGSAFALVRLIYEAYIRGVWIHRCASTKEIEKYKKGKIEKVFGDLIAEIESVEGYEIGTLSRVKETSWNNMNSYTHSGFNQIVRRITESSIEPNYHEKEIKQCIYFATLIGLMSALEIALMARNENLSLEILEAIKGFSSEMP